MTAQSAKRSAWLWCAVTIGFLPTLSPHHASAASARTAFVDLYRCEILTRLERIHQRGPISTSRDRFIVASLRNSPQSYVQCIFVEHDTKMHCEASSGAYRYRAEDQVQLVLSPGSLAALHRHGFVRTSPTDNFSREVEVGAPPDLKTVAELMLMTLHDVYHAGTKSRISITAPMADLDGNTCIEPGV